MNAPELPPEAAEVAARARAQACQRLAPLVRDASDVLDQLVGAGFAIPGPVVTAVETLAGFGVALAANANGHAAPEHVRKLLGLV